MQNNSFKGKKNCVDNSSKRKNEREKNQTKTNQERIKELLKIKQRNKERQKHLRLQVCRKICGKKGEVEGNGLKRAGIVAVNSY